MLDEQQDYQRASNAYLVWPLALAALVREPATASRWTRIHTRQALTFGLFASIAFVVLLALPMLIVIADGSISTGMTVAVYGAGIVLDTIAFIWVTVLAFGYAARAGRGELFTIAIVTPIADRLFRVR
jgi:hypothetical protein